MQGKDMKASKHGANESMNNMVNDKEQRTGGVHGELLFIPDRLYQQIFLKKHDFCVNKDSNMLLNL